MMVYKRLKNKMNSAIYNIFKMICLLSVEQIVEQKIKSKSVFSGNGAISSFLQQGAISSFLILLVTVFFIAGCSTTYAPVEHRNAASYDAKKKYVGKTPIYHRVKKGDTLYSIAWMYGQDYKSIAYRNKIKAPYRIFVGDKLRLTTQRSSTVKSNQAKTSNKSKNSKKSSYKNRTTSNSSKKVIVKRSTTKSTGSQKKTKRSTKNTAYSGSKRLVWNWPVKGKVIQRYLPKDGKKGIDISAAKGTLIKSAEAGKVVYSGQGLVGYGRLIIIKHNDTFLSAYAHNQNLLVNEGQLVKKGQNIARLGRSGTDRYKLHFEIRKNGKPVNPMSYLPH